MVNPAQRYGQLHSSAETLIERARHLAGKQSPDPLYFLYAALDSGNKHFPAGDIFRAIDPQNQKNLIELIRFKLQTDPPPASLDGPYQKMNELWTQEAQKRKKPVTDALILWVILKEDQRASAVLDFNERENNQKPSRADILRELENLINARVPEPPPPVPGLEEVTYSRHVDDEMFYETIKNLLNHLADSARDRDGELVVVCGHRGSPIEFIAQVLAHHLAHQSDLFKGRHDILKKYKLVQRLHLAIIQAEPKPDQILKQAKAVCLEREAILLLDQLERLDHRAAGKLRAELATQGDGLLLGRYVYSGKHHTKDEIEKALGIPVRLVVVEKYPSHHPERTVGFLQKYYFPEWAERGFSFMPDAFNSVITLEPGAWVDMERWDLPYLAVHLAEDTIQTAIDGPRPLLETLKGALEAIEELETEANDTSPEDRARYQEVLANAKRKVQELAEKLSKELQEKGKEARLTRDAGGRVVLTDAHIVAELLCHNGTEFHYPRHQPTLD